MASKDAPANQRGGTKEGTGSRKCKTAKEYFNQPNPVIKKWRTEKKGDTIEMEGRRYYWCKNHKHPQGFYDGLYVSSHKEVDHDRFVAGGKKTIRYSDANASANASSINSDSGGDSSNSKKLTLNQKLKEVLCTKFMLSDNDVEHICNEVGSEN